VLYNPSDYGRYDSGVLYFERSNYEAVRKSFKQFMQKTDRIFSRRCLCLPVVAPGLAAEEPNQKFTAQESFGMNRCQIITNGFLEAWQKVMAQRD